MERKEIEERIISVLLTMTKDIIYPDTNIIEDLGLSSLDILLLAAKLEKAFNIKISESEISETETVSDIIELVNDILKK